MLETYEMLENAKKERSKHKRAEFGSFLQPRQKCDQPREPTGVKKIDFRNPTLETSEWLEKSIAQPQP